MSVLRSRGIVCCGLRARLPVEVSSESVELVSPELAIGGQPRVDLGERLGPEHVQPPLGLGPDGDEARVPQHPEVLGRPRLAAAEQTNELTDGAWALPQEVEDSAPGRFADDVERAGHDPKITSKLYTSQDIYRPLRLPPVHTGNSV
jgi:hypothetical protein